MGGGRVRGRGWWEKRARGRVRGPVLKNLHLNFRPDIEQHPKTTTKHKPQKNYCQSPSIYVNIKSRRHPPPMNVRLSKHQEAVLALVAQGWADQVIARKLNTSTNSVRLALSYVYKKLGLSDPRKETQPRVIAAQLYRQTNLLKDLATDLPSTAEQTQPQKQEDSLHE